MKKYLYIIISLSLGLLAVSCQQKYEENWDGIRVDSNAYSIDYDAEKIAITVFCNGNWTAQLQEGSEWINLVEKSGNGTSAVHCTFTKNTGLSRRGLLVLSTSDGQQEITLVQKAGIALPQISMLTGPMTFPKGSYKAEGVFATNIPNEYFSADNLRFSFGEDAPWISNGAILEKEDTLQRESIPNGRKKFYTFTLAANGGSLREAWAIVSMKDAGGVEYKDSVRVIQSADAPYISNPSMDVLNQPGGSREINLDTNLDMVAPDFTLTVEYPSEQTSKNFVSDVKMNGNALSYTVSENNDTQGSRYASIRISYTDLAGTTTEAVQQIEQSDMPESFDDFKISTLAQFLMWNRSYSSWSPTDRITLLSDIDMSGVSDWAPHEFKGTFIGNGHRIYNFAPTANSSGRFGLFSILSGEASVKSLVIGSANGTEYDGRSILSITGSVSSAMYAGMLAGQVTENATITDITNFADISIKNQPSGNSYIGGIVGDYASTGEVESCVNYGRISSSVSALGSNSVNIGGVFSQVSKNSTTLDKCRNYGSITVAYTTACSNTVNYGGIVGYTNMSLIFNGCSNEGSIKVSPKSKTDTFCDTNIGGILGYANTAASTPSLNNCTNSGSITNWCGTSTSANAICLGGIVGKDNATVTYTSCSNTGNIVQGQNPDDVTARQIYAGGIVGKDFSSAGSISKCSNGGNISISSKCPHEDFAGGIAGGLAAATTITDSHNTGNVTNSGSGAYVYFGGIAGFQQTSGGDISLCSNSGDIVNTGAITGANGLRFGGIVGQVRYITIEGCSVSGDVTSSTSNVNGKGYCAGIAGLNNGGACTITGCSVTKGNISAANSNKFVAAIVGTEVSGTSVSSNKVGGGLRVSGTAVTSSNFESLLVAGGSAASASKSMNSYTE